MKFLKTVFLALIVVFLAACTTTPAIDANGNPVLGPDGKQMDRVCIGVSCPIQKLIRGDEMGKAVQDRSGVLTLHIGADHPELAPGQKPQPQPVLPAASAQPSSSAAQPAQPAPAQQTSQPD